MRRRCSGRPGRRPDFFIVGAPKCGTTALSEYLRWHPAVFFSEPKEPYYWCDDLPGLRRLHRMESLERYLRLFAGADARHRAVGEGSTLYLSSTTAVPNILRFEPSARFVVMIRDPVEIAQRFHLQLLRHSIEDEPSFARAWALQGERRRGRWIPRRCAVPELLQYREIARVGGQTLSLLTQVRRDRVLAIVFDDFAADPRAAYRRVLAFLGVEDDGRQGFRRVNESTTLRWPWLARLLHSRAGRRLAGTVKPRLGEGLTRTARRLKDGLVTVRRGPDPLPASLREELAAVFAPDVELLENILGRDLTRWKESS